MQVESASSAQSPVSDQNPESNESPETKTVAWNDHKRAMDDMHKYKKQAREMESQLKELNSKLGAKQHDELKEKQLWKEVAEKTENEKNEIQKRFEDLKGAFKKTQKFDAVYRSAKNAGLRKEAEVDLDLLPLDEIEVEATSGGRFLINGVDEYVNILKKSRPHWFENNTAPKINTGGANNVSSDSGELTTAKMVELKKKDPKKYRELFPQYLVDLDKRAKQRR